MHYSSLFQYLFINVLASLLYLKIPKFLSTSLLTFLKIIILVWWTHTYRIKAVAHPSYINNHLKGRIHYASLSAMLKLLHSKANQGLYEKHLCNQSCHYEKYKISCMHQIQVPCPSIIVWKVKYPLSFLFNYFISLHKSNQDLVEKHLCNQFSHYEK